MAALPARQPFGCRAAAVNGLGIMSGVNEIRSTFLD
jgi:hypothetical protein